MSSNKYSLVIIGCCYYGEIDNYTIFSLYINKNNKDNIIGVIECVYNDKYFIEGFKNINCCNEIKKIITWLNKKGSNNKLWLLGVDYYNEKKIHQITKYKILDFDKIQITYSDISSLKTNFKKYKNKLLENYINCIEKN